MVRPEQNGTTQNNPTLRRNLEDVVPRKIKPWNNEIEQSIIAFFEGANPEQQANQRGADFFSEEGIEDALIPRKLQE